MKTPAQQAAKDVYTGMLEIVSSHIDAIILNGVYDDYTTSKLNSLVEVRLQIKKMCDFQQE